MELLIEIAQSIVFVLLGYFIGVRMYRKLPNSGITEVRAREYGKRCWNNAVAARDASLIDAGKHNNTDRMTRALCNKVPAPTFKDTLI